VRIGLYIRCRIISVVHVSRGLYFVGLSVSNVLSMAPSVRAECRNNYLEDCGEVYRTLDAMGR
jgi:hypothetical protein